MAAFNRPQFLHAAVGSVMAQSLANWEMIIVDDGSNDPTRQLLRDFESAPRIRVLRLAHTGKPGVVRNVGARAARGQFVAFIDSDDVWLPTKLERQLSSLRRRPDCRWSYTAYEHIDADGKPVAPTMTKRRGPIGRTMLEAVVRLSADSALPTVMVERDLLFEVGLFDEALRLYEDHDLWLRLALKSEADVVQEPLVLVRRHDEHFSGTDDIATFEDRNRFLDKMAQQVTVPALRPHIRRARALNGARLARLRARQGLRAAAIHALRRSIGEGWRYSRWWMDAACALSDFGHEIEKPRR